MEFEVRNCDIQLGSSRRVEETARAHFPQWRCISTFIASRPNQLSLGQIEVVKHDVQVTMVGLEVDVKEIAPQRNASTDGIGSDIPQHSDDLATWDAKSARFIHNNKADHRASDITHSGHQAKD
jgi:hypothetical protein